MDEFGVYAPPADEVEGTRRPVERAEADEDETDEPASDPDPDAAEDPIAAAIRRLNEHLADPEKVAFDRSEIGGILRPTTRGIMFISVAVVVLLAPVVFVASGFKATLSMVGVMGSLFGVVAAVSFAMDVLTTPPVRPTSPVETLRVFFKAHKAERYGYAWSILCPTAREREIETPALGKLTIVYGKFVLRTAIDFEHYLSAFLRPGTSTSIRIKNVTLAHQEGDVATVNVHAVFVSHKFWLYGFVYAAAIVHWILGIIALVAALFVARRTHEVTFRKTLIRGSDGFWYFYSGEFIEEVIKET